jgi:hypothetical protein
METGILMPEKRLLGFLESSHDGLNATKAQSA